MRKLDQLCLFWRLALALAFLCAAILLAPFIYAYCFCQIQGDDFDFITKAMFIFDVPGGIYEAAREWVSWSGRFSLHFLFVFLGAFVASSPGRALVCFLPLVVLILAALKLARNCSCSKTSAALFSLLCAGSMLCCYQAPFFFYTFTDALSSILGCSLFFLFFVLYCRYLAQIAECPETRAPCLASIAAGIVVIGIYEHAALAVFWCGLAGIAWLAANLRKGCEWSNIMRLPGLRQTLHIQLWLWGALLLSFLAPGNFRRGETRGAGSASIFGKLHDLPQDLQDTVLAFFHSHWPLSCACLSCILFLLAKKTDHKPGFAFIPIAIVAMAFYSATLLALFAFTEISFLEKPKQLGNYSMIIGVGIAAMVYAALRLLPSFRFRVLLFCLVLCSFFFQAFNTVNFRACAINSANGELVMLDAFMTARERQLEQLAAEAGGKAQWPNFGIMGEIEDKSARNPAPKAGLPQAVVDPWPAWSRPVYEFERFGPNPAHWPNIWAAWMYGLGGIRLEPSNDSMAIELVGKGKALELMVPEALRKAGVAGAWLAEAQGNLGPVLDWLVLKVSKKFPKRIFLLRPNLLTWKRLAPLPLQEEWLASLLEKKETGPDLSCRLAGSIIHYTPADYCQGEYCAFPLGLALPELPRAVFASFNNRVYFRLAPWLK